MNCLNNMIITGLSIKPKKSPIGLKIIVTAKFINFIICWNIGETSNAFLIIPIKTPAAPAPIIIPVACFSKNLPAFANLLLID